MAAVTRLWQDNDREETTCCHMKVQKKKDRSNHY